MGTEEQKLQSCKLHLVSALGAAGLQSVHPDAVFPFGPSSLLSSASPPSALSALQSSAWKVSAVLHSASLASALRDVRSVRETQTTAALLLSDALTAPLPSSGVSLAVSSASLLQLLLLLTRASLMLDSATPQPPQQPAAAAASAFKKPTAPASASASTAAASALALAPVSSASSGSAGSFAVSATSAPRTEAGVFRLLLDALFLLFRLFLAGAAAGAQPPPSPLLPPAALLDALQPHSAAVDEYCGLVSGLVRDALLLPSATASPSSTAARYSVVLRFLHCFLLPRAGAQQSSRRTAGGAPSSELLHLDVGLKPTGAVAGLSGGGGGSSGSSPTHATVSAPGDRMDLLDDVAQLKAVEGGSTAARLLSASASSPSAPAAAASLQQERERLYERLLVPSGVSGDDHHSLVCLALDASVTGRTPSAAAAAAAAVKKERDDGDEQRDRSEQCARRVQEAAVSRVVMDAVALYSRQPSALDRLPLLKLCLTALRAASVLTARDSSAVISAVAADLLAIARHSSAAPPLAASSSSSSSSSPRLPSLSTSAAAFVSAPESLPALSPASLKEAVLCSLFLVFACCEDGGWQQRGSGKERRAEGGAAADSTLAAGSAPFVVKQEEKSGSSLAAAAAVQASQRAAAAARVAPWLSQHIKPGAEPQSAAARLPLPLPPSQPPAASAAASSPSFSSQASGGSMVSFLSRTQPAAPAAAGSPSPASPAAATSASASLSPPPPSASSLAAFDFSRLSMRAAHRSSLLEQLASSLSLSPPPPRHPLLPEDEAKRMDDLRAAVSSGLDARGLSLARQLQQEEVEVKEAELLAAERESERERERERQRDRERERELAKDSEDEAEAAADGEDGQDDGSGVDVDVDGRPEDEEEDDDSEDEDEAEVEQEEAEEAEAAAAAAEAAAAAAEGDVSLDDADIDAELSEAYSPPPLLEAAIDEERRRKAEQEAKAAESSSAQQPAAEPAAAAETVDALHDSASASAALDEGFFSSSAQQLLSNRESLLRCQPTLPSLLLLLINQCCALLLATSSNTESWEHEVALVAATGPTAAAAGGAAAGGAERQDELSELSLPFFPASRLNLHYLSTAAPASVSSAAASPFPPSHLLSARYLLSSCLNLALLLVKAELRRAPAAVSAFQASGWSLCCCQLLYHFRRQLEIGRIVKRLLSLIAGGDAARHRLSDAFTFEQDAALLGSLFFPSQQPALLSSPAPAALFSSLQAMLSPSAPPLPYPLRLRLLHTLHRVEQLAKRRPQHFLSFLGLHPPVLLLLLLIALSLADDGRGAEDVTAPIVMRLLAMAAQRRRSSAGREGEAELGDAGQGESDALEAMEEEELADGAEQQQRRQQAGQDDGEAASRSASSPLQPLLDWLCAQSGLLSAFTQHWLLSAADAATRSHAQSFLLFLAEHASAASRRLLFASLSAWIPYLPLYGANAKQAYYLLSAAAVALTQEQQQQPQQPSSSSAAVSSAIGRLLHSLSCQSSLLSRHRLSSLYAELSRLMQQQRVLTPAMTEEARAQQRDCLSCLTGDHRVLTRCGWQSITRVQVGDDVLSFNLASYAQEWKPVLAVQSHAVDPAQAADILYRMQGSGMDVIATRDHRMLLARLNPRTANGLQLGTPIGYDTVDEVLGLTYAVNTQSQLSSFPHSQARSVICAGYSRQPGVKVVIPGLEQVCDWWWQQDGQRGFLQFLGFWLSDGWLSERDGCVCVRQRREAGERWLEQLLPSVFPRWWRASEPSRSGCAVFTVRCPPLWGYLRLMAVGPLGYNPRDPLQLRNYPHFTKDEGLAAKEQQSGYCREDSISARASTWTEAEMLAAFTAAGQAAEPERCCGCRAAHSEMLLCSGEGCQHGGHLQCAGLTAVPEGDWLCPACSCVVEEDPLQEADNEAQLPLAEAGEEPAVARRLQAAGQVVWWHSGQRFTIDGQWFCLKRWLGAQSVAEVYSRLSRQQAVALLDGFCRADGAWQQLVQYDDHSGQPTGQWRCSHSSFPLIDQLMLIGQLAGAAVELQLHSEAGKTQTLAGRRVPLSVDHWALRFTFTRPARLPLLTAPLAQPVDVSADLARRGYYRHADDGRVWCITVQDNANFLTQRLSRARLDSGGLCVRARPVFVGNCLRYVNTAPCHVCHAAPTIAQPREKKPPAAATTLPAQHAATAAAAAAAAVAASAPAAASASSGSASALAGSSSLPAASFGSSVLDLRLYKLGELSSDSKYGVQHRAIRLLSSFVIPALHLRISYPASPFASLRCLKTVHVYFNSHPASDLSGLPLPPAIAASASASAASQQQRDGRKQAAQSSHWTLAKAVSLSPSQRELRLSFALPLHCSFLLLHYAAFHPSEGRDLELLKCPRCHIEVQRGVCPQCRENAYQCRQCRNINYDNLTGFLCNECGHCRYGSFSWSVLAAPGLGAARVRDEDDCRQRQQELEEIGLQLDESKREADRAVTELRRLLQRGRTAAGAASSGGRQSVDDVLDTAADCVAELLPAASASALFALSQSQPSVALPFASGGASHSHYLSSLLAAPSAFAASSSASSSLSACSPVEQLLHGRLRRHHADLSKTFRVFLNTRRELARYTRRPLHLDPTQDTGEQQAVAAAAAAGGSPCFLCGRRSVQLALKVLTELPAAAVAQWLTEQRQEGEAGQLRWLLLLHRLMLDGQRSWMDEGSKHAAAFLLSGLCADARLRRVARLYLLRHLQPLLLHALRSPSPPSPQSLTAFRRRSACWSC